MAKIAEYIAPKTDLRPSDAGYQAFETAGRRLGSMYREAAADEIAGAKVAGAMAASAIEFPYLLQSLATPTGVSVNTVGAGAAGGGKTDALGLPIQGQPNLAAENAAAAAQDPSAGKSPLAQLTGVLGKVLSIPPAADGSGGNYGGGGDPTITNPTPAAPADSGTGNTSGGGFGPTNPEDPFGGGYGGPAAGPSPSDYSTGNPTDTGL
jgi:hypothetical protein